MSNDMSYHDVCAIACTKPAREQTRKDQTDQGRGIVEKELMNGRVAEEMTEKRRAPRAANLIGTGDRDAGSNGNKDKKAKARVKPDTATIAESKGISE